MEDYAQAVAIAKDNPSDTSSVKTESGFKTALIKSTGKFKTFFKTPFPRKFLAIFAVVIVVSGGIWVWAKWKMKNPNSPAASQLGATTTNVPTVPVNRDFEFKVYDKNKKLADNITYTITDAQLTNQIIIKGQSASAVKGRTFFILNLKLVNNYNDSLFLNTRNYVRVQPLGSNDKLAAEIHNDTVEVQPLSTKLTRVGLPVDENTKDFKLFVGELDGEKTEIDVKFP